MRIKNLPSIESMNGSQDALIIEQTDGSEDKSRKVSPAQIKQYVLGNSIDDIYSVMGQNGAKNLIPYPYDYSSRSSLAGINYTINADGSITMNGTTTGRTNYWLYDHGKGFMNLKSGDYILSKIGRTDFGLIVAFYKGSTWVKQVTATENDMTVSIDVNSNEYDNIGIAVSFGNAGITVENVTVYPMLRLASDTDNTYEPYAKTNKELTEEIGDLSQTGLTGDSVAEQLGTAREQIAQLNDDLVATRTNITPQTGVNADNNNKCYYEKVAGVVNVVINVKQLTAGTVSRICTLPAGYRPYAKITSAADNAGTGTGRAFVNVDASGNVDAYTSATQYVSGQLTFVAYS